MFGRGLVAGVEEVSTTAKIYSLAALSDLPAVQEGVE